MIKSLSKIPAKFKIILLTIIIVESAVLSILAVALYQKLVENQAKKNSAILLKNNLNFPQSGNLKYFYEPKLSVNESFFKKPDWLAYEPVNTTNSDTLNERFEYSEIKPQATFRIITLGDSLTYGLFVDTKNNYPEQLEDLLNKKCPGTLKFEVINLGVPGYDMEYSVERFKKRGQKYNPDLVIWLLHNGNLKMQEMIMAKNQQLSEKSNEMADAARKEILKQLGEEQILDYQTNALYSIRNDYQNKLLIYSPANRLTQPLREKLQNFAKEPSIYYYESLTDLKKIGGLLPDSHPNEEGHRAIAHEIFQFLNDSNLIPCK